MDLDLDRIVAIDVHTHAEVGRTGEDGLLPELTGVKSYQPAEFKEKVDWMMERGFLAEAPDYKDVVRSK